MLGSYAVKLKIRIRYAEYSIFCHKRSIHNVLEQATSILGTSASLIPGESISIYNLLFALMLPSGTNYNSL